MGLSGCQFFLQELFLVEVGVDTLPGHERVMRSEFHYASALQHDDQRSWTSASVVTPSANRQPELSMCPWHLALAAYNSGERNIARILETGGAEDFWEMRRRG